MTITPEIANVYIIILLIGTLIPLSIAAFSWSRRDVPGAIYAALLNFFIALWLFFTAMDWSSSTTETKLLWNQLGYLCVGFLPLSWLAFTLKYTQKTWFKPIYLIVPSVVPLFIFHLALNKQLWDSVNYSNVGPYLIQSVTFSKWIALPIAFAYINNVAGTIIIIQALIKHPQKYQKQAIALIIGACSPLFLNIAYNTKFFQSINIDLTPIGFTISGLAFSWALFRYRMLNLAPYARDMLVDTMIDGLIVLDAEDNIIDLNPAADKMTINPGKPQINIPVTHAIPALKTLSNSNNEISLDIDGQLYYYDVQSSPLYNQTSQTFEGRMLTLRDVTSRKKVELKLAHNEEVFRNLIEQSYDGILLTDHQGRISVWNQSMTRITGIKTEDILGHYLWELIDTLKATEKTFYQYTENTQNVYAQLLQKHLSHDSNVFFEQRIFTPHGEERFIQNITFPIYISSNDILLGSVTHDITLSKQKEIENIRLYEEAKVLQKQAEAASEAKSQFLAVMSHELRTPMNAVLGMIQLMMDTPLSRKQMDYAEIIRSSGDTLLSIINDILDYSKIESGKIELEERPFTLRNIVEESIDMVSHQAASKGVYLIYDMAPNVPRIIRSDPTRFRQILINLLGNAVKFTDKGEVVLNIHAEQLTTDDVIAPADEIPYRLSFSIRDTGIGIPRDKLDRLFKTFSQVDQSTTRVYGGTGLGLVISKRLVEAMQGGINVESKVNHGSTFSFNVCVSALLTTEDMIERDTRLMTQGKSVLLFDENPTQVTVLNHTLNYLGMKVFAAHQVEEVFNLLNQQNCPVSLALIDESSLNDQQIEHFNQRFLCTRETALILLNNPWHNKQDKRLIDKTKAIINKPIKYYLLMNVLQQILSGKAVTLGSDAKKYDKKQAVIGAQHPLRILLVEDNLVNQKVSVSLMERLGYRISIANNGVEALKILDNQTFDVVFMDVQMAEMDGFETTRHIRNEWPFNAQPRIIALTAATTLGDRAQCLEAGMDDYISKPIHLDELANALLTCQPISSFNAEDFTISLPEKDNTLITFPISPAVENQVIEDLLATLGYEKWPAIQESIRIFITESGQFIKDLDEACYEQNIDKMHRLAHTLKSTSASVGAISLSEHCKTMDTKLKMMLANHQNTSSDGSLQEEINLIKREFSRACKELQEIHDYLPKLASTTENSKKTD